MIGLALFAQLAVVAHAPDTATACAPVELSVAARAPGVIAPSIAPPAGGGLQLLRSTVASRVDQGAAGPSAVTEATFVVATSDVGRLVLPPVFASLGSVRSRASFAPIEVRAGSNTDPQVLVRAWLDPSVGRHRDTLFVGQQVDYVVDVHLNDAARQRLRRNPTFFPPEMPGVLAYDIAPPIAPPRGGARCFATLSYRRALFPLFAGRTAIAPATLTYSLPLSTSFFSREESFELHTDSVRFLAREAPTIGRPPAFAGAVGDISASARLSTTHARMGDPVVLTLRLTGAGNVKLWPRPALALPWATAAASAERVTVDTTHTEIGGTKEFDWLLTPREAGVRTIPSIEYAYFRVARDSYDVARTAPLELGVTAAALASVDSAATSRLPLRRGLGDEASTPLTQQPWFWVVLALAPLPAAGRRIRASRTRNRRGLSPRSQLRSRAALKGMSPRRVRRLYLDALRERVTSLDRGESAASIGRTLRRAGVTEASATLASELLNDLDVAAFSTSSSQASEQLAARADGVLTAVEAEAVGQRASRLPRAKGGALVILFAASALVVNASPVAVASTFAEGVQAYDATRYPEAAHAFARTVARAPRATNAWLNLGTTAWAQGDTAAAVRAWQRTLLLDPLDDEARQNLALVQSPALRSVAWVPPMPSQPLALLGLAVWLLTWALLAVPSERRPAFARAASGACIAVSLALLGGALGMQHRLSPHDLAVLRHTRPLQDMPQSSTQSATATTGEIGRLGAREGTWVHVTLDGSREGWLPLAAMLPLDAPAVGD